MENKFITLSNQRSGSSPFQRMLHSHKQIVARQEVFRNFINGQRIESHLFNTFREDKPDKISGFKLQYSQIPPGIWDFVKKYDVKVIQLIRKDLLETALWFRDHHIGQTEGGLGPPLVVRGKVEAKINEILNYMIWLKERITENRHRVGFTVYYDQVTNNEDVDSFYDIRVRKKLLDFLGVEDSNLSVERKKNTKNTRGKSEEIVANWHELIREMKKRGIERYYNE